MFLFLFMPTCDRLPACMISLSPMSRSHLCHILFYLFSACAIAHLCSISLPFLYLSCNLAWSPHIASSSCCVLPSHPIHLCCGLVWPFVLCPICDSFCLHISFHCGLTWPFYPASLPYSSCYSLLHFLLFYLPSVPLTPWQTYSCSKYYNKVRV